MLKMLAQFPSVEIEARGMVLETAILHEITQDALSRDVKRRDQQHRRRREFRQSPHRMPFAFEPVVCRRPTTRSVDLSPGVYACPAWGANKLNGGVLRRLGHAKSDDAFLVL